MTTCWPTPTPPRIVGEDFVDTEDLGGLFSGWDDESSSYDKTSWQFEGAHEPSATGSDEIDPVAPEPGKIGRARRTDPTLQHPRSVYQVMKRHFARYTPQMVGRHLRHRARGVPRRGPRGDGELQPRADDGLGVLGRLDAPHRGRAVHPHRRHPAGPAGQHGPARRRHPRPARARLHPGLHRHPDAVQPAAGLPGHAARRRAHVAGRVLRGRRPDDRLLGRHPGLHGQPAQGLVRRRRDGGERLLLRPAAQDQR